MKDQPSRCWTLDRWLRMFATCGAILAPTTVFTEVSGAPQEVQQAQAQTELSPATAIPEVSREANFLTPGGQGSFLTDFPALNHVDGTFNVVVEIPAGTAAKWEVERSDGVMRWEIEDGRPRVVNYLPYPGNYGMVPRTLLATAVGGDGDPLDVLLLGEALERGSVVRARAVAVLKLRDDGERDDKLIAVLPGSRLGHLTTLSDLNEQYPGVTEIIRIWFENYKGPDRVESTGYADSVVAEELLRVAAEAFESEIRDVN